LPADGGMYTAFLPALGGSWTGLWAADGGPCCRCWGGYAVSDAATNIYLCVDGEGGGRLRSLAGPGKPG
jgi:hypothetical protein